MSIEIIICRYYCRPHICI